MKNYCEKRLRKRENIERQKRESKLPPQIGADEEIDEMEEFYKALDREDDAALEAEFHYDKQRLRRLYKK